MWGHVDSSGATCRLWNERLSMRQICDALRNLEHWCAVFVVLLLFCIDVGGRVGLQRSYRLWLLCVLWNNSNWVRLDREYVAFNCQNTLDKSIYKWCSNEQQTTRLSKPSKWTRMCRSWSWTNTMALHTPLTDLSDAGWSEKYVLYGTNAAASFKYGEAQIRFGPANASKSVTKGCKMCDIILTFMCI